MAKQKFDRLMMVALWHQHGGNEAAVARELGVTRNAIRQARNAMDQDLFVIDVETYKAKRVDLLAKINMRANQEILARLTDPKTVRKMGTTELNKLGGTAYDKEKNEQGLPNAIEGHVHIGTLSQESLDAIKEFNRIRSEEKLGAITYDDE